VNARTSKSARLTTYRRQAADSQGRSSRSAVKVVVLVVVLSCWDAVAMIYNLPKG
jgi:hypothetical protein